MHAVEFPAISTPLSELFISTVAAVIRRDCRACFGLDASSHVSTVQLPLFHNRAIRVSSTKRYCFTLRFPTLLVLLLLIISFNHAALTDLQQLIPNSCGYATSFKTVFHQNVPRQKCSCTVMLNLLTEHTVWVVLYLT